MFIKFWINGSSAFSLQDEELYQLFCGIKQLESAVEAVRVIRDRATSLGKGIAYVLFKTRVCLYPMCIVSCVPMEN